jgi:hypothetical protein
VLAASLAAVGFLFDIQSRLPDAYMPPDAEGWRAYLRVAPSVGVLLPLAALLWLGMKSRLRFAAYAIAAAALAFSLAVWDARSAWSRYLEHAPHPFAARVPPGAQVFWPAPSSPAWTALHTTNWFSADQGAGIVFTRATAIEWPLREAASRPLREAIALCQMLKRPDCAIAAETAAALCRRPEGPDFLVLNGRVEGWQPLLQDAFGSQLLRLYACRPGG